MLTLAVGLKTKNGFDLTDLTAFSTTPIGESFNGHIPSSVASMDASSLGSTAPGQSGIFNEYKGSIEGTIIATLIIGVINNLLNLF